MSESTLERSPHTRSLRQPAGLYVLSWTELWERFSFYGIQVILAYYIYYSATDGGLGLSELEALAITGAYGGAVYLSQPVGAWMSDRLVPARTMVAGGSVLVMGGHTTLAFVPGLAGLLAGLALIVIGTGALFPNILGMMHQLYEREPDRREFGFSLYYTGILLGALVGPLVTGFLQVQFDFHVGFFAAAIGMLLALVGFLLGMRVLPEASKIVPNPLSRKAGVRAALIAVVALSLIAVVSFMGIITIGNLATWVLVAALAVSALYFMVMLRSQKVDAEERKRVYEYLPIFVISLIFWTMILQLFTTFAIYADTRVDLVIGAITIPPAYISTFQVVTGIIMGPVIAAVWQRWAAKRQNGLAPTAKLSLSFVLMALTFTLFAVFPLVFAGAIPLVAVIVGMVLLGMTEVSFAPTFFSLTGLHAPKAFNSQMMALGGLTLSIGSSLSGLMGQFFVVMPEPVFFGGIAVVAVVCALILARLRSRA